MFKAKVITDSISQVTGNRLVTLELEYPRYIHPEFLTHRVFSRNSQSSRAYSTTRYLEKIKSSPVVPVEWGANCKGMVALSALNDSDTQEAMRLWLEARDKIVGIVEEMRKLNVHKQVINRLLEPFLTITTLVTSTEWDNFFKLRLAPDAQPEMQKLAQVMQTAMKSSKPKELEIGEFHLPYIQSKDLFLDVVTLLDISACRCARISYLNQDSAFTYSDEVHFAERLRINKHLSPLEHQAACMETNELYANFKGWRSYRNFLEQ